MEKASTISDVDDNRTSLKDFGRALEALLNGRPRGWLGAEVARVVDAARAPFSSSAVTQWIDGDTEPTRDKVFAMEQVLGVAPGTLSRFLGYLPVNAVPATGVRDAILSDPNLRAEFRTILAAAYDTMRREEDPTYKPDTGRRTSDMPAGGGVKAVRTSRARAKI